MIRVNDIRKSFGGHIAVDGLSFNASDGEVLGLLGPNGAGKTTTLHMMMGALPPDSGSIEVDGGSPSDPGVRLKMGLAPQSIALYDDLTAEENLGFFAQIYGLSKKMSRNRIDWALDFAGLQDRRGDAVKTFSGGMKRRLNIACGLIHEPKVVFLDEPTVGVDPQSRNHIFESVERLKGEGLTVIYTTHYMEEAERLCDRVGILERGKLLALETVPALMKQFGGTTRVFADLDDESSPDGWRVVAPGKVEKESNEPYEEIAALVTAGHTITHLRVEEPNLENVFLGLTGRSLRD